MGPRGRLAPSPRNRVDPYLCVNLHGRKRNVHILVAEAFLGPRPAGADVMHIDGVGTHNAAANLRYGTRSENTQQAWDEGRQWRAQRRLTQEMADGIRAAARSGRTHASLAAEYGISRTHVTGIITNRFWKGPDAPADE